MFSAAWDLIELANQVIHWSACRPIKGQWANFSFLVDPLLYAKNACQYLVSDPCVMKNCESVKARVGPWSAISFLHSSVSELVIYVVPLANPFTQVQSVLHVLSATELELFFFMKGPICFQYEAPDLQTYFSLALLITKEFQRKR